MGQKFNTLLSKLGTVSNRKQSDYDKRTGVINRYPLSNDPLCVRVYYKLPDTKTCYHLI